MLGRELGRKKQGDRKIEDSRPRSVLTLKGSGSQSHGSPASQGGPQMLPTERTRGAAAAAIQPSAPGSQQLFQDKERQVQRPAPAGTRGAPLSGEEGAGAGVYLFHLPIARGGQAGTALCTSLPPPSPTGLHRSLKFFYLLFFPPSQND